MPDLVLLLLERSRLARFVATLVVVALVLAVLDYLHYKLEPATFSWSWPGFLTQVFVTGLVTYFITEYFIKRSA